MIDRLTAARRKVERANRHIADLEKIVASLPDLDIATVERDVGSGYQIVKHSIPGAEKIAIEMALVLGDAIQNLRVGMEYAYLGAIERHAPSILDGNTKFPARYETRQDLESALRGRKVDILAPRLFDVLINPIKPYKVGGNEFFFRLHELDISDKHWLLVPVTNYAAVAGIIVEDKKGHTVSGDSWGISGFGPYEFAFAGHVNIEHKGKLAIEVVFDDETILNGMAVTSMLRSFSNLVLYTIQAFEGI